MRVTETSAGSDDDSSATGSDAGHDAGPDVPRRRLLREEVGRLRVLESRRRFDPSIHVGDLGGERTGTVLPARDEPAMDAALKIDISCRLVEGSPSTWRTAWLVRPGAPDLHDLDLQWLAAVRTAFGIHARRLDGCYAVTRSGWRDIVTGDRHAWARLRL